MKRGEVIMIMKRIVYKKKILDKVRRSLVRIFLLFRAN